MEKKNGSFSTPKLMGILAHPDDESLALGGALAHYAAEGVDVSLVVATRGEYGWFGIPEDYPGPLALGRLRERELRKACAMLGVSRLDMLDYIDGELDQASSAEMIASLVRLLRQVRPQVVVTFGPEGLYGHPDHIAISQFATAAVMCTANPEYAPAHGLAPHSVSKLYYRVGSRNWFSRYMPIFGELVMNIDGQKRRALPWVPWSITTRIDASASWQQVWRAVLCHQSQLSAQARLQPLSEQEHRYLWGTQEFYRALSLVNSGREEEHDLFDGLREQLMIGSEAAQLAYVQGYY
jgi:LmbE family N-acetylglucosaminyl deacetylase